MGATLGTADDQGPILLDDCFPVPKRVQPRVLQSKESGGYRATGGPFYQVSHEGEIYIAVAKIPRFARRKFLPRNRLVGRTGPEI